MQGLSGNSGLLLKATDSIQNRRANRKGKLFNTKILFDHTFTDILKTNSVLSIIHHLKDVLACLAQHLILICSAKIFMFSEWAW